MSIEASKGRAGEDRDISLCSGMEICKKKKPPNSDQTVQLARESKSQGRKAPPILRSQVHAQGKSSTKESEEQFH